MVLKADIVDIKIDGDKEEKNKLRNLIQKEIGINKILDYNYSNKTS